MCAVTVSRMSVSNWMRGSKIEAFSPFLLTEQPEAGGAAPVPRRREKVQMRGELGSGQTLSIVASVPRTSGEKTQTNICRPQ